MDTPQQQMQCCSNCCARFPVGQGGIDTDGRVVCCPHCLFNPRGCRCKDGQYGEDVLFEVEVV